MRHDIWLKKIGDFKLENSMICPNCGEFKIKFQFIGDKNTHIGHTYLWCEACLHGIHLSRVTIPEGGNILPFDVSIYELSKRVPKYKLIT